MASWGSFDPNTLPTAADYMRAGGLTPPPPNGGWAPWAGLKVGTIGLSSALAGTVATIQRAAVAPEDVSKIPPWMDAQRLSDYLNARAQEQGRPDLEQAGWFDSPGTFASKAAYTAGQMVPALVGAGAAMYATPEVAIPAGLSRIGAALPSFLGGAGALTGEAATAVGARTAAGILGGMAVQVPSAIAAQHESSMQQPGGESQLDAARALALGVPLGAIESIMPGHGAGMLAGGTEGKLLSRVIHGGLGMGAVGAVGGGLQKAADVAWRPDIPTMGKMKSIVSSTLESGAIGGVMGGLFGLRKAPESILSDPNALDAASKVPGTPPEPQAEAAPSEPQAGEPTTVQERGTAPVDAGEQSRAGEAAGSRDAAMEAAAGPRDVNQETQPVHPQEQGPRPADGVTPEPSPRLALQQQIVEAVSDLTRGKNDSIDQPGRFNRPVELKDLYAKVNAERDEEEGAVTPRQFNDALRELHADPALNMRLVEADRPTRPGEKFLKVPSEEDKQYNAFFIDGDPRNAVQVASAASDDVRGNARAGGGVPGGDAARDAVAPEAAPGQNDENLEARIQDIAQADLESLRPSDQAPQDQAPHAPLTPETQEAARIRQTVAGFQRFRQQQRQQMPENPDDILAQRRPEPNSPSPIYPYGRVDPNAEEWRLYHGTSSPISFDKFDVNAAGKFSAVGEKGVSFFSASPEEAAGYAGSFSHKEEDAAGPRVYPVRVTPGKSAVFDVQRLPLDPEFRASMRKIATKYSGRPTSVEDAERLGRMFDKNFQEDMQIHESNKKLYASEGEPEPKPNFRGSLGATSAAIARARQQGLDTVILRGIPESRGRDQVAVLNPDNIRSALDPKDILAQRRQEPLPEGLGYSTALRALDNIKQDKMPGPAWEATLKSAGAKQTELDWTHTHNWLADQKGPITKAQIAAHFKEAFPAVHTVTLDEGNVHYEPYTTPGGTNYREVLFRHILSDPEEKPAYLERYKESEDDFTHVHWPGETNFIGHNRMDNRVAANSEKILHSSEAQSDLHQKAQDEGYRPRGFKPDPVELAKRQAEHDTALDKFNTLDREYYAEADKLGAAVERLRIASKQHAYDASRPDVVRARQDYDAHDASYSELSAARDKYQREVLMPTAARLRELQNQKRVPDPVAIEKAQKKLEAAKDPLTKALAEENRAEDKLREAIKLRTSPDSEGLVSLRKEYIRLRETTYAAQVAVDKAEQNVRDTSDPTKGVPEAPLKNTTQWMSLMLKHMIHEAVRTGQDRITWDTGETNFARYGGDAVRERGMKVAYNEMMVNEANKLVKKFGSRVEPYELPIGNDRWSYEGPRRPSAEVRELATHAPSVSYARQLRAVADALERGVNFNQAVVEHGSTGVAELLGGKLTKDVPTTRTVHSFPITDQLRAATQMTGHPLFKTVEPMTQERMNSSVSQEALRQHHNELASRLNPDAQSRVHLLDTVGDMPPEFLSQAVKQGLDPQELSGFYDNGHAYTILDKARTRADIEDTFKHEVMGHMATEALLGPHGSDSYAHGIADIFDRAGGVDNIEKISRQFGVWDRSLHSEGVASYLPAKGFPLSARDKVVAVEEMIAHASASTTVGKMKLALMAIVGKFKQAIATRLRDFGLTEFAKKFETYSVSDVAKFLRDSRERLSAKPDDQFQQRLQTVSKGGFTGGSQGILVKTVPGMEDTMGRTQRYVGSFSAKLGDLTWQGVKNGFAGFKGDKLLAGMDQWSSEHSMGRFWKGILDGIEQHRVNAVYSGQLKGRIDMPKVRAIQALDKYARGDKKMGIAVDSVRRAMGEFNVDPTKTWGENSWLHNAPNVKDLEAVHMETRANWNKLGQSRDGSTPNPGQQLLRNSLAAGVMDNYGHKLGFQEQLVKSVYKTEGIKGFENDPFRDYFAHNDLHQDINGAAAFMKSEYLKREAGIRDYLKERSGALSSADEAGKTAIRTETAPLASMQAKFAEHTAAEDKRAPYVHLGRTGDNFVSMYIRTLANGAPDPAAIRELQQMMSKDYGDVSMNQLSSQGHVFMRFKSSQDAAGMLDIANAAKAKGLLDADPEKEISSGAVNSQEMQDVAPKFVQEFVSSAEAHPMIKAMTDEQKGQFLREMRALAMDVLPDNSIKKLMAEKQSIQGYSTDMTRNAMFSSSVTSNAVAKLASLRYRMDILAGLRQQRLAAASNPAYDHQTRLGIQKAVDEIMLRDSQSGARVPHTYRDMAQAINHGFYLGMSPSYVLEQMSQVGLLAWPEFIKKHGAVNSALAIGASTNDAFKIIRAMATTGENRVSGALTPDILRKARVAEHTIKFLTRIINSGAVELGMGHVGSFGTLDKGTAHTWLNKALHWGNMTAVYGETASRLSVALAAERLGRQKGWNDQQIHDYALHALNEAMMPWEASNQPRAFGEQGIVGSMSKIVTAFHGYQLKLLEKLYLEVHHAISSANPEEKVEARRFLLAHGAAVILTAGTLGLPGAGWAAGAMTRVSEAFDEGEGYDIEAHYQHFLRSMFGPDVGALLSRGLPRYLGVDTADLGDADILPGTRLLEDRRKFEDAYPDYLSKAAGSPFSILQKWVVGGRDIANGQTLKGMQEFLPTSLRNLVGAFRMVQGDDGKTRYVDKNGMEMPLTADARDVLATALGFETGAKSNYQETNRAAIGAMEGREFHAGVIEQKYKVAMQNRDRAGVLAALEEARAYDLDPAHQGTPMSNTLGTAYMKQANQLQRARATGKPTNVPMAAWPVLQQYLGR
jgi:hypothetical protein